MLVFSTVRLMRMAGSSTALPRLPPQSRRATSLSLCLQFLNWLCPSTPVCSWPVTSSLAQLELPPGWSRVTEVIEQGSLFQLLSWPTLSCPKFCDLALGAPGVPATWRTQMLSVSSVTKEAIVDPAPTCQAPWHTLSPLVL